MRAGTGKSWSDRAESLNWEGGQEALSSAFGMKMARTAGTMEPSLWPGTPYKVLCMCFVPIFLFSPPNNPEREV